MGKFFKKIILILPFFLTAFSSVNNGNINSNSYNLMTLKNSSAPQNIKLTNIDNIAKNKPLTENGVLVTYKSRAAKNVSISGDFSKWEPVKMNRGKYGVWYYFLNDFKNMSYIRYKFLVDGNWTMDPMNTKKIDDGSGSYVSIIHPYKIKEKKHVFFRFVNKFIVEFRIYKPKAKLVSIVGDFNNWNPENDLLIRDKKGVWTVQKRLSPGAYRYKYIVDGDWIVDLYNNKTTGDGLGGVCSIISVK